MPDWKKTVGVLGAEASPEEKAEWHEKLASFVAEPDLAIEEDVVDSGDEECDEHALPQVAATDSSRMVGNAIAARALDHGLQAGMGHALRHFKARVKVQPLEEHEERFYILASDVPGYEPEADLPEGLVPLRACVEDKRTLETRLEAPDMPDQPGLWSVPDQGAKGWYMLFFMYCGPLHVWGWMSEDPLHRTWNDVKLILKAAGVWLVVLESTIAINLTAGPFDGAMFFGQLVEAMDKYMSVSSFRDALFISLYEKICRDLHDGELPVQFGKASHMQAIFLGMRTAWCFVRKGTKTKIMRWFSWFDCIMELLNVWHYFLLVLMFLLRSDGTIKLMSDLTRNQQEIVEKVKLAKALAKAEKLAVDIKKSVKTGNVEVDALRSTCKNSKHLTGKIMANALTNRICHLIVLVVGAVRDMHARHTEMMPTKRGSFEFSTSMARGDYEKVLANTCALFSSVACLRKAGFEEPPPPDRAARVGFSWAESGFEDDNVMSTLFLNMIVLTCGYRGITAMTYQFGLPKVFSGLVDRTASVRQNTLRHLQNVWEALAWAERLALVDKDVRSFLFKLVWPRSDWIRSVLIVLSEYEFKHVPTWLSKQLKSLAEGIVTTEICEVMFNNYRDAERKVKSAMVTASTLWTRAVGSKTVEGYDRASPPITNVVKNTVADMGKVKVNNNTFKHNASPFSFGEDQLRLLLGQKTWPSANPSGFADAALGTSCLAGSMRDGERLRESYKSLLAEVTWVLKPRSAVQVPIGFYIVCRVTEFGVLARKLAAHAFGEVKWLQFDSEAVQTIALFLHDEDDWLAMECEGIGPSTLAERRAKAGDYRYIDANVIVSRCEPSSLLKLSARTAFRNLTVPNLRKLAASLGVDFGGKKPSLAQDWVRVILKNVFPDMPDDELLSIVKLRAEPRRPKHCYDSVLTHGDNANLLDDAFDEGERAVAKKEVQQNAKRRVPGRSGGIADDTILLDFAAFEDGADPSASSSSCGKKKIHRPGAMTPEWAKTLKPLACS
jgi:hypothetical protein